MQVVALKAEKRESFGKKANNQLRKKGKVPAVVYAKDGVEHITVSPKDLKSLIYTPEFKIAEIDIDGTKHKAIIKDMQFHPVTDSVVHVDFLRLIDGVTFTYNVPVAFKGVAPGVKQGGKLVHTLRKVKLRSTPENMVDNIIGDISGLKLGGSLRIKDLKIVDGVDVLNPANTPVGIVEVPRAAKSLEQEAEEAAAEEAAEAVAAEEAAAEEAAE